MQSQGLLPAEQPQVQDFHIPNLTGSALLQSPDMGDESSRYRKQEVESENYSGWKGALDVIWSNPLLKAGANVEVRSGV